VSSDKLVMEKIDREKAKVEVAAIDSHRKEDLLELLDHAENICNGGGGSLENVARAVGAQLRVFVKAQIDAAEACAKCKANQAGWRGMIMDAKWPIALFASFAVFSPNFARFAEIIERFVK